MAVELSNGSVKLERRRSGRLNKHFDSDSSLNVKQILVNRKVDKKVEVCPIPTQVITKSKKKESKENPQIAKEIFNAQRTPHVPPQGSLCGIQENRPSGTWKESKGNEEIPLTAKEVFNLQHPPNVSHKERLCWIQENRLSGTWVQCTAPTCKKWRYLKDILDPTIVASGWTCALNEDKNFNSCYIPTAPYLNGKVLITLKYDAGSIVLVKSVRKGVKWWPAMVDDDPHYEQFYWPGKDRIAVAYHVVYFDEPGKPLSRDWRNDGFIKKFTPELNWKCEPRYAERIRAAHKAAFKALKLTVIDRLIKFSYIRRYKGPTLAGLSEWIKYYYYKNGCTFKEDSDSTISSCESSTELDESSNSKVQFNLDPLGPTNSYNRVMELGDASDASCSSIESPERFTKVQKKKTSVFRRTSDCSSAYNNFNNNTGALNKESMIKSSKPVKEKTVKKSIKNIKRKESEPKRGKEKSIKKESIKNIKREKNESNGTKSHSWYTTPRVKLGNLPTSELLLDKRLTRRDSAERGSLQSELTKIEKKYYKIKGNNAVILKNKIKKKSTNMKPRNSLSHIYKTKLDIKRPGMNKTKLFAENLRKNKHLIVRADSLSKLRNQSLGVFNKPHNFGEDANRPLDIRRTPRRGCKNEELNYSIYWWHKTRLPNDKGARKRKLRKNSSFHVKKSTVGEYSGYFSDCGSLDHYVFNCSYNRRCESECDLTY